MQYLIAATSQHRNNPDSLQRKNLIIHFSSNKCHTLPSAYNFENFTSLLFFQYSAKCPKTWNHYFNLLTIVQNCKTGVARISMACENSCILIWRYMLYAFDCFGNARNIPFLGWSFSEVHQGYKPYDGSWVIPWLNTGNFSCNMLKKCCKKIVQSNRSWVRVRLRSFPFI